MKAKGWTTLIGFKFVRWATLVSAFWEQIQIERSSFWHMKEREEEQVKLLRKFNPLILSNLFFFFLYTVNPTFMHLMLHKRQDVFHLGWQLWMQMPLNVKSFLFISRFKRTFTCRASQSFYVCSSPLVWNVNQRFKRQETLAWHENQHGSTLSMGTQCLFHTYICAYAGCTHIYTVDIHVLYA